MMVEYQMTLDDLQYAELIATQSGRSAYIDESGGFGFDFTKEGASAYYVVCSVVVDDKDIPAIEQKVLEMRNTMFGGKEMKSSSIGTDHRRRAKVLTAKDFRYRCSSSEFALHLFAPIAYRDG